MSQVYSYLSYRRTRFKWRAQIQANKISYELGLFDTEIEAAKAYDEKAKQLHGDYACLNFPEGI